VISLTDWAVYDYATGTMRSGRDWDTLKAFVQAERLNLRPVLVKGAGREMKVFEQIGYDMHVSSISRQWKGLIDIDPLLRPLWEKEVGMHYAAVGVAQKVSILNHLLFKTVHHSGWSHVNPHANWSSLLPRPVLHFPLKEKVLTYSPGALARCQVTANGGSLISPRELQASENAEVLELRRRLAVAETKLKSFNFQLVLDDGKDDAPLVPLGSVIPISTVPLIPPSLFVPSVSPLVNIKKSDSLLDVVTTHVVSHTTTTHSSSRPSPPLRLARPPIIKTTPVYDRREEDRRQIKEALGGLEKSYHPDGGRIDYPVGQFPDLRGRQYAFDGDQVASAIIVFLRLHPGSRPDEIRYCVRGEASSKLVLLLHKMKEAGLLICEKENEHNYWWAA